MPTVGLSVEQFTKSRVTLTVFDMSGTPKYRQALWEQFYADCNAIIFVLDASDRQRLPLARQEFENMLQHKCNNDLILSV